MKFDDILTQILIENFRQRAQGLVLDFHGDNFTGRIVENLDKHVDSNCEFTISEKRIRNSFWYRIEFIILYFFGNETSKL